jgi:hypothetical protein
VQLYKALGGGWHPESTALASPDNYPTVPPVMSNIGSS